MKWVTRTRPKTDRIACPWLIRRFIDPDAEILYVPTDQVLGVQTGENAIGFDTRGARYDHRDGKCTFEVLIDEFGLGTDPALNRLADIVHAADIAGEIDRDPFAPPCSRSPTAASTWKQTTTGSSSGPASSTTPSMRGANATRYHPPDATMVVRPPRAGYGASMPATGEWVLLAYRIPRQPSTPRITIWRKLRRLGAVQLLDGLVALPCDARTKEHLEWIADEVEAAGGEANIWLAHPATKAQERALAEQMTNDVEAEYDTIVAEADAAVDESPGKPQADRRSTAPRAQAYPPTRPLPQQRLTTSDHRHRQARSHRRRPRGRAAMRWATRSGCHIDRAASSWLITRFIDPDAAFVFVDDPDDVPTDATPFDMRGVELTHRGDDCTFETILRDYALADPVLWDLARIVHEADLDDERFDAPEAAGLDVALRGLSLVCSDDEIVDLSQRLFDGLYQLRRRALLGQSS